MFIAEGVEQWVMLVSAALVSLVVFTIISVLIVRFLRFLLVGIPSRLRDPANVKAVLSVVIALVPLYDLTQYLARLCYSFASFVGTALNEIFNSLRNCSSTCATDLTVSVSRISDQFVSYLQFAISGFPVSSVLIFILLAATIFAILNSVQGRDKDGTPINGAFDAPGVTSLTFIGVILFSLYLSLSALLAVPLMQPQVTPEGYSQTQFEMRINAELPTQSDLLRRFSELSVTQDLLNKGLDVELLASAGFSGSISDRLAAWNTNRDAAYQALANLKSLAIETFRSQSALGLGGREVVTHDAALHRWVNDQRDAIYRQLTRCLAAGRQAIVALNEVSRTAPQADTTQAAADPGRRAGSRFVSSVFSAEDSCAIDRFGVSEEAPGRTNRVEGLTSFIRDWTRWLIGPESMPLIIIVGLVGFSFLGACLSRIIRFGIGEDLEGLSLTDLLLVVLSGASAALMIFLASYGGLAVLGESTSDPSAYVVFALCFVASIFSEDVWIWARENILGRFRTPGNKGGGEEDQNTADKKAQEAKRDEEAAEKAKKDRETAEKAKQPTGAPKPTPPGK